MIRLRLLLVCALLPLCGIVLGQGAAPKEIKNAHEAIVYSLAFSPDGTVLASAGYDNVVKLWNYDKTKETLTEQRQLKADKDGKNGHTAPVYCVVYNKDGTILASSSVDKTIRLWNPKDGKHIREIKGHTDVVDSLAFSPDGKYLASASGDKDKTVRVWNVADGKEVKNLGASAKSVYCIAFSPDGKLLASGGADNIIKVYDMAGLQGATPNAAALKELKQLKGHTDTVSAIVFTPDSKELISISQDQTVQLWDVAGGKVKKKLGTTQDWPQGICLAKDGKSFATCGYGGWLHTWKLDGDKPVFSQKIKPPCAYCVVYTPDGKSLITGHDNHSIVITPLK